MKSKRSMNSNALTSIVIIYKKLHNWFFSYFIFILLFLGVVIYLLFFLKLEDKSVKASLEQDIELSLNVFHEIDSISGLPNHMDIVVSDGYSRHDEDRTISVGNLGTFEGWTLPKYFYLSSDIDTDNLVDFTGAYDVVKFEELIKSFLSLKNGDNLSTYSFDRKLQEVNGGLESFFVIECISKSKLFDNVCNIFVDKFLDEFYIYDLKGRYIELYNIALELRNNSVQKTSFCDGMLNYVKYSHDKNILMNDIFSFCGEDYEKKFFILRDFVDIQSELDKRYTSNNVYNNLLINEYKLISLQQMIYNELLEGSANITNLEFYVDYLNSLLRASGIREIYYDWTYWFNNYFLVPRLNQQKYKIGQHTDSVNRVVEGLSLLNKSNDSLGMRGLDDLIINPGLKDALIVPDEEYVQANGATDMERKITSLKNSPFFNVVYENIVHTLEGALEELVLEGYIFVDILDKEGQALFIKVSFDFIDNSFYVKSINIEDYVSFSEHLTKLISSKRYSLFELYTYISNNIDFYANTQESFGFCELLEIELLDVVSQSSKLAKCDDDAVFIQKGTYRYRIYLKDNNILTDKFLVNDTETQSYIEENIFSLYDDDTFDLANLIVSIVAYDKDEEPEGSDFVGSDRVLISIENINTYLRVNPTDIVEVGDNVLAEINIQGIGFIINYDLNSDTIKQIFFKDIKIEGKSLKVSNFDLILDSSNKNMINLFVLEPLEYIKKVNFNVYLQYIKEAAEL